MHLITLTALLFLTFVEKPIPADAKASAVEQSYIQSSGGDLKRADEAAGASTSLRLVVVDEER